MFCSNAVKQIDRCLSRLAHLRFSGASHYYKVDLDLCLRGGALLGALHVVSSLLELLVREVEISRMASVTEKQFSATANFQRELEKQRKVGFKTIIDNLTQATLVSSDISEKTKAFYDYVRIPIHHGLPLRFVEKNTNQPEEEKLLLMIFGHDCKNVDFNVGMQDLEEAIENVALKLIDTGITLVEEVSKVRLT